MMPDPVPVSPAPARPRRPRATGHQFDRPTQEIRFEFFRSQGQAVIRKILQEQRKGRPLAVNDHSVAVEQYGFGSGHAVFHSEMRARSPSGVTPSGSASSGTTNA